MEPTLPTITPTQQTESATHAASPAHVVPTLSSRPRRYWPWIVGVTLVVVGLLGLDLKVYHLSMKISTMVTDLTLRNRIESFWDAVRFPASIYGGLAVFSLLLIIDPSRWHRFTAAMTACLLSGAFNSFLKMTIARSRPDQAGLDTHLVFHPFTGFAKNAAVSFPSGEASMAFALATAISMMFPRLTWPCYILAVFTCLARVLKGAHYVSDVAAGAMIATLGVRLLFPVFESAIRKYLPARNTTTSAN